jgi:hypothetical protein
MKRFIQFVVRLYPASWRNRYGVEFAALLEDVNPGWRTSLDILKGALEMQMRTWNFGKILVVAGLAGAVVGLGLSFAMPRQYVSEAVIKMVPSADLPVANQSAGEYVLRKAKGVLSRSSLTHVIQTFGLYADERAKMPLEEVVELMKKKVHVGNLTSPHADGTMEKFVVQFIYDDPVVAQRVTQGLVARFIEENAHDKRSNAGPMTFEVIDPANQPGGPISPNRSVATTMGLAAGMALGVLLTLLRRSPKASLST